MREGRFGTTVPQYRSERFCENEKVVRFLVMKETDKIFFKN